MEIEPNSIFANSRTIASTPRDALLILRTAPLAA